MKEVLWRFTYIKEKTLVRNYKKAPNDENEYRCKSIVNTEELHLKN